LVALGGLELNRVPLQNWLVRVPLRFERGPLTAKV